MWTIDVAKASEVFFKSLMNFVFIGVLALFIEHRLKKSLFEHQTRFSKLHEKRAEVIAELYRLLVQARRSLETAVSPRDLSQLEVLNTAKASIEGFSNYFDKRRLYFPKNLCAKLIRLTEAFSKVYLDCSLARIYDYKEDTEALEHLRRSFDAISQEVPRIRQAIEDEFRQVFGDINETQSRNR